MRCAPAMESSLDDAMRRAFARAARGSIASSSRASTRARVDVPVASWTTRVASILRAVGPGVESKRRRPANLPSRARVDVDAGRSVRLARRVSVVHGG